MNNLCMVIFCVVSGVFVATYIALACFSKVRRQFPINFVCLAVFVSQRLTSNIVLRGIILSPRNCLGLDFLLFFIFYFLLPSSACFLCYILAWPRPWPHALTAWVSRTLPPGWIAAYIGAAPIDETAVLRNSFFSGYLFLSPFDFPDVLC